MTDDRVVVHVDDDPAMLDLVRTDLGRAGYEVISENDPTKAIPTIVQSGSRVVILDVDMGETNGLQLLKSIKEQDLGLFSD